MKATDWAYLAGFVDGEGCISVKRERVKNTGLKNGVFRPYLSLSQKDHVCLANLYEKFSVGYFAVRRDNDQARWQVASREDLRWILEGIIPYLTLKRTQAELALQLLDDKRDEAIVTQISELKRARRISG